MVSVLRSEWTARAAPHLVPIDKSSVEAERREPFEAFESDWLA